MKSTADQDFESIDFFASLHIRLFAFLMGVVSVVGALFSFRFLFYMFDILSLYGNLPVPNIPVLLLGLTLITQCIALIFVGIYFASIFSLKLQITPESIMLTSYWYRLESSLDNIAKVDTHSSFVGRIPVLLLKSPGTLTSRRGKKGMYKLDSNRIPLGLFGTLDQNSLLGQAPVC